MDGSCQISAAWFLSLIAITSAKEDMRREAAMTPCQLVRYHGYPCKTTYVTTEDGFMLQVVRVPHGIRNDEKGAQGGRERGRQRRHPVLFVPPLLESSAVYFINFPSESPGFLFADSGYDVWAMSNREARQYSNSTRYSQRDPRHWNWSFDEIGRYDLSACIDHVLEATGAPKLTTVAFSQGVLASLVLHSVRPQYNNKVDLLVAYAPVGNLTHIGLPYSVLIPHVPSFMRIIYPFTVAGYIGTTRALRALLSAVCTLWGGAFCILALALTNTCSLEQLNITRIPMYMGHMPTGTTVQNLLHFHQVNKARNFVMYDYGPSENLRRYGQRTAPAYPLDRIRLPIALFWSYGDNLAGEADVGTMAAALSSNVIFNYQVPVKTFRHLDFATGYRSNELLHNVALELLQKRIDRDP